MLPVKIQSTWVRLPPPPFLDALRLLKTSQTRFVEKCLEQAQRAERLLSMYFFYILQCTDNRLYVGSCEDPVARFKKHEAGQGAEFTQRFPPKKIAYSECFATRQEAVQREMQVKRWSETKKRALIQGKSEQLKNLAITRMPTQSGLHRVFMYILNHLHVVPLIANKTVPIIAHPKMLSRNAELQLGILR